MLISTLLKHHHHPPPPSFMQGMVLPGVMLATLAVSLPREQGPVEGPSSAGGWLVPVPVTPVTSRAQSGCGTGSAAARQRRVPAAALCAQLPRWEASREGQRVIKMC